MKVIFLDIDGVLNTSKTFTDIYNEVKETGKRRLEIDLSKVDYLKRIVDATSAVIVLSSTWRLLCNVKDGVVQTRDPRMSELITIFYEYGLSIYDVTPRYTDGHRDKEICEWLSDKNIESFLVIDDDPFDSMVLIPDLIIKTKFQENGIDVCGLCQEHVEQAIDILNNKSLLLNKRIK